SGTDTIEHRYGANRIFNAPVNQGPLEVEPSMNRCEYAPAVTCSAFIGVEEGRVINAVTMAATTRTMASGVGVGGGHLRYPSTRSLASSSWLATRAASSAVSGRPRIASTSAGVASAIGTSDPFPVHGVPAHQRR